MSQRIIVNSFALLAEFIYCGHTHAGQICLPGIGPLFTHCRAPIKYVSGVWHHKGTVGYTLGRRRFFRGPGAFQLPA